MEEKNIAYGPAWAIRWRLHTIFRFLRGFSKDSNSNERWFIHLRSAERWFVHLSVRRSSYVFHTPNIISYYEKRRLWQEAASRTWIAIIFYDRFIECSSCNFLFFFFRPTILPHIDEILCESDGVRISGDRNRSIRGAALPLLAITDPYHCAGYLTNLGDLGATLSDYTADELVRHRHLVGLIVRSRLLPVRVARTELTASQGCERWKILQTIISTSWLLNNIVDYMVWTCLRLNVYLKI